MTRYSTAPVVDITGFRDAVGLLVPASTQAGSIDRIRELEELKAACAAAQAQESAALETARHQQEADRGVPKARRGKGLGAEIALARGDSPARGTRHLNLARALVNDLPKTFAALTVGQIHEEHAEIVAKETSWLSAAHRKQVDALIAEQLGSMGPRRLATEVRGHAQRLDQPGAVAQLARAKGQRRVAVRPAADNMAQLTAFLPMPQAVAIYDGLHRDATTMVGTGDTSDPSDPSGPARTRDQLMADLFVERVTGQTTATAVPAEVQLVMTDEALLGDDDTPAWLTGHGPIPATTARQWLADPDAAVFLRRLFTRPGDHQLVGMDSRSRAFPAGLRQMVIMRDGTCRTPNCDALIQHIDHIVPVRDRGTTSWDNASGLCAACNMTKENTGWYHEGNADQLAVSTPTGHRYTKDTAPVVAGRAPPSRPPPRRQYYARSATSPIITQAIRTDGPAEPRVA